MNKTMRELHAEDLPRATCDSTGLGLKAADDSEETAIVLADAIAEINGYLSSFAAGETCPGCGSELGGWLGSFTWGIATGEGYCTCCKYPARGQHATKNVSNWNIVLAYHPSLLAAYGGSPEYELEKAESEAKELRLKHELEGASNATD